MRKTKLVTVLPLLLATLGYSGPILAEEPLAAADNAFGFNLLAQLSKDHPATDISISPYSAATVLHMVGNGAAGTTKAQMQQVLGTSGLSDTEVNAASQEIAHSLGLASGALILTTANAIWYRPHTPVKPSFISTNQQFYGATVEALNFADPHATDVINAWANDKTQGKIKRIADEPLDPDSTRLFLANATYFKGKWYREFEAKNTKDRAFHLGGGEKRIPMMLQAASLLYLEGRGYQAVSLPYIGRNLAMYVFLPDRSSSPGNVLGILSGDSWQKIRRDFRFNNGTLVLPRFKIEYNLDLKNPLQSLGMRAAFDAATANFAGIAPKLFIYAARQKTFVEVNEEGTEAAALTGMEVHATSISPKTDPFEMIVDRPFLFLIEEQRTGVILFLGVVFDPTAG